jgi:5'-phosphate synthase pdxT subunit
MIGILALQGGYAAHGRILKELGLAYREVRIARDLVDLDALILPGGESTTMLKLMRAYDLREPLDHYVAGGGAVLGTCAGAILMCEKVTHPHQDGLNWVPASIERNAYGSQRESFSSTVTCTPWQLEAVPAYFIRAPKFVELVPGVTVLSRRGDEINGIIYKRMVAVTYHPELADDLRFHQNWYQRFVSDWSPA